MKKKDGCRNVQLISLSSLCLLNPAATQRCNDVLHVFTYHRELLPSSSFIKSHQKLLRKLKDFSSTVGTYIPDAAGFTIKQKNTSCFILYKQKNLLKLLCMCCCPFAWLHVA